jgi:glycosyltransferase involved in cell wall biosynthesis
MRIAIPMQILRGEKTGIGYYALNLIRNLAKIDKANEYLLYTFLFRYFGSNLKNIFIPNKKNFIPKFKRIPARFVNFLHDKINIPIESFIGPIDVLHSLDSRFPLIKNSKLVVTIHDIAFMLFPKYTSNDNFVRNQLTKYVVNAARLADGIITVSNNSKKDIIEVLGVPETKITVTYEAADTIFRLTNKSKCSEKIKQKYGFDDEYILCVSTLEPRKNISGLIKAFSIAKKSKNFDFKLVIVGGKSWYYEELAKLAVYSTLDKDVIFMGYVPEDDLPLLYNCARLFVFPSFYEGFGLPLLEAMGCGLPIVASDNSSIPEVVGDAGVLVDAENTEQIAETIYQVSTDESHLQDLRLKGLKRAKTFSWENTAKKTLQVYNEVYSQGQ